MPTAQRVSKIKQHSTENNNNNNSNAQITKKNVSIADSVEKKNNNNDKNNSSNSNSTARKPPFLKKNSSKTLIPPATGLDADKQDVDIGFIWYFIYFYERLGKWILYKSFFKPKQFKPKYENKDYPREEYLGKQAPPTWSLVWLLSHLYSLLMLLLSIIYVVLVYVPVVIIVNIISFIVYLVEGDSKNKTPLMYALITEMLFLPIFLNDKGMSLGGKIRILLAYYFTPALMEGVLCRWRLKLLKVSPLSRGMWWKFASTLLEYHCRVSYFLRVFNPPRYFTLLNEKSNVAPSQELLGYEQNQRDFFPFGDGVAVVSGQTVQAMLKEKKNVNRHKSALKWELSSLGDVYSIYNPTYLSTNDKKRVKAVEFITSVMNFVTERATKLNNCKIENERTIKYLDRFLLPQKHFQISEEDLVRTVGDLKFFLVTNGQFMAAESEAYQYLNSSSHIVYPWNQLPGHPRSRAEEAAFDVLRQALWRRLSYDKELSKTIKESKIKNKKEVLKLLTLVFAVFLSYTTKLCVSVVKRLHQDPMKSREAYERNPVGFIWETARLNRLVPMISHLSTEPRSVLIAQRQVNVDAETPLHLIIACANREWKLFRHPWLFDSTRKNLPDDVLTFESILYATGCDQKTFALEVTQYIADRFRPTDKYMRMVLCSSPHINSFYSSVLDGYTLIMMSMIGSLSHNHPRAIEMFVPVVGVDESLLTLRHGPVVPMIDEDNVAGDNLLKWVAREIFNSNAFAITDLDAQWCSVDEAKVWTHQHFGPGLPVPTVVYDELESDEVMSRLAFFAMPCYYTRKTTREEKKKPNFSDFEYVNDASHVGDVDISTIPVRGIYDRYGAMAYFDKDYKIKAIYWSAKETMVYPNSDDWAHAKWVWKSSWFMIVTVNDHLMVTHLTEANALAKATQLRLPVTHPLRRFLKPFTFQTVSVNKNAVASLINERGFVHRVWAFDYTTFVGACNIMHKAYKFKKMPDFAHESMRNEDDRYFPFNKDSQGFWTVIYKFVSGFFEIHENLFDESSEFVAQLSEDLNNHPINNESDLIDVITQLIVNGTGKHELVGQVSDYTIDPRFVGCKLQPNMEINNVQTYTQLMALTLLTGFRMPMLKDDWSHLYGGDRETKEEKAIQQQELDLYFEFRNNLDIFEKEVDARNHKENRKHPFLFFHPQQLECSVSI